jgi:hypothetical protein
MRTENPRLPQALRRRARRDSGDNIGNIFASKELHNRLSGHVHTRRLFLVLSQVNNYQWMQSGREVDDWTT